MKKNFLINAENMLKNLQVAAFNFTQLLHCYPQPCKTR